MLYLYFLFSGYIGAGAGRSVVSWQGLKGFLGDGFLDFRLSSLFAELGVSS